MSPRRDGKSPARGAAKSRQERSAGGVVVRAARDRRMYLLIRDSYGHWGFPKGHLERGERADRAALREVMEETGLRTVSMVDTIATIDWHFRMRGVLIHKHCEFFLMETDAEDTYPQRSEGITACKWVTASEGERLIGYENARAVLRRADEMVEQRARAGGRP